MFKLGLTGGIGSGKTQVADWLAELGAAVIDTDVIAHELTSPEGRAIKAIRMAFGEQAINASGALDRDYMRTLVFDNPTERARLEAILHPMIAEQAERAAARASGAYLVFVVPLLVESGRWADRLDRICVVDCERQTQIERVQLRSGLSRERIERIIDAQASREQRLAAADHIIDNGTCISLEELRSQVLGLHRQWCNLAG